MSSVNALQGALVLSVVHAVMHRQSGLDTPKQPLCELHGHLMQQDEQRSRSADPGSGPRAAADWQHRCRTPAPHRGHGSTPQRLALCSDDVCMLLQLILLRETR